MLVSLKAKNCYLFDEEIELSMRADTHIKKFADNIADRGGAHILKSAIVLGPNNAGKTKLTECIWAIRNIMLNHPIRTLESNFFGSSSTCELTVSFIQDDEQYTFEVRYDTLSEEYVYERLSVSEPGQKEHELYVRDTLNQEYRCMDDERLAALLPYISKDNILIYLLNPSEFKTLNRARNAIIGFASKVDVVDMGRVSPQRTVERMQDPRTAQRIKEFVLNADLSLEDFYFDEELSYLPDFLAALSVNLIGSKTTNKDVLGLTSVYRGKKVPSILFDSRGTRTVEAIAAYVIDALEQGRVLVIDELDSSLHFRLTRAIVSLFNNEANRAAQLIATTHDPTLLDCKKLFRKEQVWFAHKDEEGVYLYSLADFTAREHGVRGESDLFTKYQKGVFGALPDPDLVPILLELDNGE